MNKSENVRIKIIRNQLGLTQKEFAEKLGMQQGSYSDIEREKNSVSSAVKILIEQIYNVNLEWFETGKGEPFMKTKKEYLQIMHAKLQAISTQSARH